MARSHHPGSLAAHLPTCEVLSMQVKPASSLFAHLYLRAGKRSSFNLLTSQKQTLWMAVWRLEGPLEVSWLELAQPPSPTTPSEGDVEAHAGRGRWSQRLPFLQVTGRPAVGVSCPSRQLQALKGSAVISPHHAGRKDIICTLNIHLCGSGKNTEVREEK